MLLITIQTLVITILSTGTRWLCIHVETTAELPLYLIDKAVTFPFVFSIDGAYKSRKERSMRTVKRRHHHTRGISRLTAASQYASIEK